MDLWSLTDLETPWCVYVAATLRVAEHIEKGKHAIEEIAGACGADAVSLGRVLRHLASKGCFAEPSAGRFELNETARGLLDPGMQIGLDLNRLGGRMARAWATLPSAVRTGKAAYREIFGRDFWEDLAANPEIDAEFDNLMGAAGHGVPDPDILLSEGEWAEVRSVADVGGGTGAMLCEVLRAHPGVRGVLIDRPGTIESARELIGRAGLSDRVTFAAQSFFDPLPSGFDIYIVKNTLADWADAEAKVLLHRCADAAQPFGRVVICGGISPEERVSPALLMLVLVGGRERSLEEFRVLAGEAGLEVSRTGRQKSGRFVVVCRPSA